MRSRAHRRWQIRDNARRAAISQWHARYGKAVR